MEDYIVIILTIIILIIGVVGRNKRKNMPQSENDGSIEPDNLWGLMDELGLQPNQQPVETLKDTVEIIDMPVEKPAYKFIATGEGGSILKDRFQKKEKKAEQTKQSENIKDERFSLRKAVIYSEILNRKYT